MLFLFFLPGGAQHVDFAGQLLLLCRDVRLEFLALVVLRLDQRFETRCRALNLIDLGQLLVLGLNGFLEEPVFVDLLLHAIAQVRKQLAHFSLETSGLPGNLPCGEGISNRDRLRGRLFFCFLLRPGLPFVQLFG